MASSLERLCLPQNITTFPMRLQRSPSKLPQLPLRPSAATLATFRHPPRGAFLGQPRRCPFQWRAQRHTCASFLEWSSALSLQSAHSSLQLLLNPRSRRWPTPCTISLMWRGHAPNSSSDSISFTRVRRPFATLPLSDRRAPEEAPQDLPAFTE